MYQNLMDYANHFGYGFLKAWKAESIIADLQALPVIMEDEVRFLEYLKSCLQMEGFRDCDIELIMGWLYERLR